MDAEELLDFFSHAPIPGLYVLSSRERRVTVYSQQIRALNLVRALVTTTTHRRLKAGDHIAVVGGGIAGVTAAAAALIVGARVDLYEMKPVLLPLQTGNSTRWLHPRIYDWPLEVAATSSTDLPFLNWDTGTAGDVAEQILRQFEQIHKERKDSYQGILSCTPIGFKSDGSGVRLYQQGKPRRYSLVIAALGFGMERSMERLPFLSYWHNDAHAQYNQPQEENATRSYLISGTGDGGLIDLLRVRIRGFRQDRIVDELFAKNASPKEERYIQELLDGLRSIYEKLFSTKSLSETFLEEEYEQLKGLPGFGLVRDRLRLRSDTSVVLLGRRQTLLGAQTSMLHSFLVCVLREVDDKHRFKYLPGRLSKIERIENGWKVEIKELGSERVLRESVHDEVIIRHGATLPEPKSGLLEEQVKSFLDAREGDQTRNYNRDLTGRSLSNETKVWWQEQLRRAFPRRYDSRANPAAPRADSSQFPLAKGEPWSELLKPPLPITKLFSRTREESREDLVERIERAQRHIRLFSLTGNFYVSKLKSLLKEKASRIPVSIYLMDPYSQARFNRYRIEPETARLSDPETFKQDVLGQYREMLRDHPKRKKKGAGLSIYLYNFPCSFAMEEIDDVCRVMLFGHGMRGTEGPILVFRAGTPIYDYFANQFQWLNQLASRPSLEPWSSRGVRVRAMSVKTL